MDCEFLITFDEIVINQLHTYIAQLILHTIRMVLSFRFFNGPKAFKCISTVDWFALQLSLVCVSVRRKSVVDGIKPFEELLDNLKMDNFNRKTSFRDLKIL